MSKNEKFRSPCLVAKEGSNLPNCHEYDYCSCDIQRLEKKLQIAKEALEFYDCHQSKIGQTVQAWDDNEYDPRYLGEIPLGDFEILQEGSDSCNLFLGKRAREALKKIKDGE